MDRGTLVWGLLLIWFCAFAGAFVAFTVTPPSDFGFTRGLNRLGVWMSWQGVAALLALALLVLRGTLPRGTLLRGLALVPAVILGAEVLALAGLLLWASLSKPPAIETERPPEAMTAPAVVPSAEAD